MNKSIEDMDIVALARTNKEYLSIYDLPVDEDMTLTVTDVIAADIENPKTRKTERKHVLCFKETEKKLVPNTTNTKILRNFWGYTPVRKLIGKTVTLYVDPSVSFGREKVGGIRIRKPGETRPPKAEDIICERCGQVITAPAGSTVAALIKATQRDFGKNLCQMCARALKQEAQE